MSTSLTGAKHYQSHRRRQRLHAVIFPELLIRQDSYRFFYGVSSIHIEYAACELVYVDIFGIVRTISSSQDMRTPCVTAHSSAPVGACVHGHSALQRNKHRDQERK